MRLYAKKVVHHLKKDMHGWREIPVHVTWRQLSSVSSAFFFGVSFLHVQFSWSSALSKKIRTLYLSNSDTCDHHYCRNVMEHQYIVTSLTEHYCYLYNYSIIVINFACSVTWSCTFKRRIRTMIYCIFQILIFVSWLL